MILEELFDRYLEDGNDFPETQKKMKEAMIYLKDKGINVQEVEGIISNGYLMNNWQGFVSGFSYGITLMMEIFTIKMVDYLKKALIISQILENGLSTFFIPHHSFYRQCCLYKLLLYQYYNFFSSFGVIRPAGERCSSLHNII